MPLTYLYSVFCICATFIVVPSMLCNGLLVPIIKKQNLDPGNARNYRPITISAIPSKLLEYYVIENCENVQLSKS